MTVGASETMNLSGTWRLQLDRENAGLAQQWFARPLENKVQLPGSLPAQDIGDEVRVDTHWTGGIIDRSFFTAPEYEPYRQSGHVKVPFWLQPEKVFVGAAWYQREIDLPADWNGRRIVLTLERPHWKTTAWLDGRELGSNDSLSVAHEYDLGTETQPGRHVLTLRVDNTFDPDIGENSHSVSDHTQGNWNGVVGRIELTATAPTWIDDLQVFSRTEDRHVRVRGRIGAAKDARLPQTIQLTGGAAPITTPIAADGQFTADVPFGSDSALWDEFTPVLHHLRAKLENGETKEVAFGFRTIAADGRQLTLNGRKLFLRGTLECAAFPRTGHPPVDVDSWRREFGAIRAHGLNHVRFHSWCPPEEAFVAADELGVYLQIEVSSWPNQSTTLGDGKPVDDWLDRETGRILRAYGNHPSFVMLCAGNEPGGEHFSAWLVKWLARQKTADSRRLYTSGSGWPEIPENNYHVTPEPRIQHWGEGLKSRINACPPETFTDYRDFILSRPAPVISHEIGQWCVYPNFGELPKYTGYLKPRNFEIFRSGLEAHGLGALARDFLFASGKLQALCYKEDIESALRTPAMGGFQLLGLNDFPGQGTALVGVLDAFWEEKGYITPADFRRFCNSTVPLARLERRVVTSDEHFTADVEIAHFGPAPLTRATTGWKLVNEAGAIAAEGKFPSATIKVGAGQALGHVDLDLRHVPAPAHYKFVITVADPSSDNARFENDWDVWVYPPAESVVTPAPGNVLVTQQLDANAQAALDDGRTVWLMISPERVRPDPVRGKIALGFSSIFWNTAWTSGQAPHTLGILCDPHSPALAGFPTESYSNWQWWYVVSHAAPMLLDASPTGLTPVVRVIDDWFTNRSLALIMEVRVGRGRLLVTSIDFNASVLDPVRRQLRRSLLDYLASPKFAPATEMTPEQVKRLYAE
jgi:hypothetical protein